MIGLEEDAPCCVTSVSQCAENMVNYYLDMESEFDDLSNAVYVKEMFGYSDDVEFFYNRINDLHYLNLLLQMICLERYQLEQYNLLMDNGETIDSMQTYYDNYNIQCITEHFNCYNINVIPGLEAYGIAPLQLGDDSDGIGYMDIGRTNRVF